MKRINQILLLSLFLFLFACSTWNENVDSSVVASVGDARLLAETVKSQIPAYLGSEERQKYAEKIIEKWVKEQILVSNSPAK
jgi:thioredoxin-related protein